MPPTSTLARPHPTTPVLTEAPERFQAKVAEVDGHWIWTAATTKGYPVFWWEGVLVYAHRWAYETFVGPIPDGHQVDHVCRVTLCVRPHEEHLEAVTPGENVRRSDHRERRKTECPRGHAYDEANTRVTRKGGRACRACDRDRDARRRR